MPKPSSILPALYLPSEIPKVGAGSRCNGSRRCGSARRRIVQCRGWWWISPLPSRKRPAPSLPPPPGRSLTGNISRKSCQDYDGIYVPKVHHVHTIIMTQNTKNVTLKKKTQRGSRLVSCEIPFQKLTIEGRIVKLIFVLYWNSGSKKNHKTLDKRRFLLYLCQQIIQNKKQ